MITIINKSKICKSPTKIKPFHASLKAIDFRIINFNFSKISNALYAYNNLYLEM